MANFILGGSRCIMLGEDAVKKLISSGNGNAALLYIYALHAGEFSAENAAVQLRMSPLEISRAEKILSDLELISSDTHYEDPVIKTENFSEKMPQYSAADISAAPSDFEPLVQEVKKILERSLSPNDLSVLLGMMQYLQLPSQVILLLVTHCIEEHQRRYGEHKFPQMRSIEKTAYLWARMGLHSPESAEQYLQETAKRREQSEQVKNILHIRKRSLVATEERYISDWLSMGFDLEALALAYDRTVIKTGDMSWAYMNSILKSWHSKGFHTVAEIEKGEGKRKTSKPISQESPSSNISDTDRIKQYTESFSGKEDKS